MHGERKRSNLSSLDARQMFRISNEAMSTIVIRILQTF